MYHLFASSRSDALSRSHPTRATSTGAGVLNRLHFPGFLASLIHEFTQLELTLTLTVPRRCPHSYVLPFSSLLFSSRFISSLFLYLYTLLAFASQYPDILTLLRPYEN